MTNESREKILEALSKCNENDPNFMNLNMLFLQHMHEEHKPDTSRDCLLKAIFTSMDANNKKWQIIKEAICPDGENGHKVTDSELTKIIESLGEAFKSYVDVVKHLSEFMGLEEDMIISYLRLISSSVLKKEKR